MNESDLTDTPNSFKVFPTTKLTQFCWYTLQHQITSLTTYLPTSPFVLVGFCVPSHGPLFNDLLLWLLFRPTCFLSPLSLWTLWRGFILDIWGGPTDCRALQGWMWHRSSPTFLPNFPSLALIYTFLLLLLLLHLTTQLPTGTAWGCCITISRADRQLSGVAICT